MSTPVAGSAHVLHVLRAERIKLTTLRSLWITPLLALLLTAGVTTAIGAAIGGKDHSITDDPSVGVFYGLNFGQAALACFGILLIGQEFNTRMINVSLTAVPRRNRLYGAKLALGALVGLAVGTAGAFAGYAATAPGVWDGPALLRSAVAGVLYQALLVVLCLGATALLGNLTAAMGLLVPTVFLLSPLLGGVPGVRRVVQFLPDRAGQYALRYADDPQVAYGHWTGLLIMALWTALAAYGGLRALRRIGAK
ncbi:ABC transporter permease [Kitasatospora xanthocidica]|uniref:ABC transporter permease n=1 Tax=Kitasatospora xanthocidica TaxID=83382 RepID=A0A373A395_9ACTN|nr:ABC transporter permease [Kitasatospora xanthocidica]RGD62521.1 ABC transporter permease [Kitasatospora xanthocidica]